MAIIKFGSTEIETLLELVEDKLGQHRDDYENGTEDERDEAKIELRYLGYLEKRLKTVLKRINKPRKNK